MGGAVPFDDLWEADPETGCHLWTRPLNNSGYGSYGGKGAHVFAWERKHGPVPEGHQVDHVRERGCRYRHCVNTDHLEPVTRSENIRRKNWLEPYCTQCGTLRDEANTYRNPKGVRSCRECHRRGALESYYRNRESILAKKKAQYEKRKREC